MCKTLQVVGNTSHEPEFAMRMSLFGGVLNAPKGDPISGKSKTVQMYGDVWGIYFPCNDCIVWVGVV